MRKLFLPVVLVAAAICASPTTSPALAQASPYYVGITVEPSAPTEGDPVQITVEATMPTPCYEVTSSHSRSGNVIHVTVDVIPTAEICPQVLWDFSVTEDVGSLPAGEYEVRAAVNVKPPFGTVTVEVTTFEVAPVAGGAAATPTPEADVYLEGTLVGSVECLLLETSPGETWDLDGDLQGFGAGDQVGIWGNICGPPCGTLCMSGSEGVIDEIVGIIGLDLPVGGMAELPELAGTPLEAPESSGSNVGVVASIAGAVAAAAIALGGATWWTRRRG